MPDPRYEHEYLDIVQILITVTGNDESDKHLEARDGDQRYSCLNHCMKGKPLPLLLLQV